jgi:hypothetical protein
MGGNCTVRRAALFKPAPSIESFLPRAHDFIWKFRLSENEFVIECFDQHGDDFCGVVHVMSFQRKNNG